MTRSLRWRVYLLQVGLIGILAFSAALTFGVGSFVHSTIRDQLVAQKIFFPPATTAVPGGALDPAEFPGLQQYVGQQVDNGAKAQAYANGFIGRHVEKVAGGQTYAQMSAKAQANPTDQKLAGQVNTLFKGETLIGLLLNAYGWWTVGQYAIYAGIGLAVAAFAVLMALAFEVYAARRAKETEDEVVARKVETARPIMAH